MSLSDITEANLIELLASIKEGDEFTQMNGCEVTLMSVHGIVIGATIVEAQKYGDADWDKYINSRRNEVYYKQISEDTWQKLLSSSQEEKNRLMKNYFHFRNPPVTTPRRIFVTTGCDVVELVSGQPYKFVYGSTECSKEIVKDTRNATALSQPSSYGYGWYCRCGIYR